MKRCPECRRDYFDDSLTYCLDDGSALLEGPASASSALAIEPQTAILHDSASASEAATRALKHTTAAEAAKGGFNKRIILAPVALAAIVLVGFFAYRYFSPIREIESIAVMPFVNESGNPEIEYLSDGMTDTLINNLSRLPKLSVKARSSVFRYKGKQVDPSQVAADLNVQAVINGRVIQRGDDLTLNLEMVDTRTGDQIWGEQYVRKAGDLVTLQSDIARDVANKLRQKLSGADTGHGSIRNTENPEAYREYLRGRYHWNRRTREDIDKSIEYFQKAIEIDPAYALAHAGLADSYVIVPSYTNNRSKEAYPKARSAALKALEIDESLAQAHATLAAVLHEFDWKFEEAEKEFKRAIELDPNYATAHQWYAEFLLTMRRGEAFAEIKRAQECDPLSLIVNSMLGLIYASRGDFPAAEDQLNKTIEMDPNFGRAHLHLAAVYERQGKYEEAITEYEKHSAILGMPAEDIAKGSAAIRHAYRTGGEKAYWQAFAEQAKRRLELEPEKGPPFFAVGFLYARAGNDDRAFQYFEKSFEQREPDILRLQDPGLDSLRTDPRFADLLRRIGLPQ
jgi:TolB-like protein/Tfp pilus assembly protein PilF